MRNLLAGAVVALTLAGCAHVSEPPPLTQAEIDAYVDQEQAAQWFYFAAEGWEQPEVDSRLVGWSDYTRSTDCQDAVYQRILPVYLSDISDERSAQIDRELSNELFACQVALILYPDEVEYYTTAQLSFIYDYYRDILVPCLQTQGLDVGYVPPREEFAGEAGFAPWDPYSELGADLPPSRATEIRQRCPALPDADFLEPR